jgi:hypothetical protein
LHCSVSLKPNSIHWITPFINRYYSFLFLLAALFQLWLGRRHQKDKAYGPSPSNNYTSGSSRGGFFSRRRARKTAKHDAEAGVIGTNGVGTNGVGHHHDHDHRLSHNTATTDSYVGNKYETQQQPLAGGYHTGPTGSGVNPYGYENERSHAI